VLIFSSGVVDSCVFWLECSTSGDKLRGQQVGRSLDAQLYCVFLLAGYTALVRIVWIYLWKI